MKPVLISSIMDKIIPAFGWMLIHSLWQGLLFAIIAGIVLMLAKRSGAAFRYNLVFVLFAAFICTCAFTFALEWNRAGGTTLRTLIPRGDRTIVPALVLSNIHSLKQLVKIFTGYFAANEPLVVLVWFVFFLFKSVKMFACLVYNQQIRNREIVAPSEFWSEKVATFAEKLQIKRAVKLLQSGYIKMPVVIGHLKPLILIPVGLLAGLPAEQVEAILLHELAHIRRNDYFVNFLQNIAEAIFFFNPGLLWISSLFREERENCCDDIALEHTQNKVDFVQALISFKEYELYGSSYAVAFPGKKNYLLRRVSRILHNKNMTLGLAEKIFFIGSILLLSALITVASIPQVKLYTKSGFINAHAIIIPAAGHISGQKLNIASYKSHIKPVKAKKLKVDRVKALAQIKNGISGISEKRTPSEVAKTAIKPISALSQAVKPPQRLSSKIAKVLDDIRVDAKAGTEQTNNEQEQARIEEEQAIKDQQQALKDQAQVKIDQAEALKDQVQARIDQEQAKKDQQGQISKDKTQAEKNEEQVLLNQIQVKKNEEQAQRNEHQARLNKIQEKKNQEQAIRNEEQARLNQIQEKKNEEQALKNNNVSVQ